VADLFMETLAGTVRQEEITARRAMATAAEGFVRRAAGRRMVAEAAGIPAAVAAGIIARSGFLRASLWVRSPGAAAFERNFRGRRPGWTSRERKARESEAAEVSDAGAIFIFELAGYRLAYIVCGMSLGHANRLWYLFPNHPA
jgi:hypothetical protein